MLIITDLISNVSDHLVLRGQQLYGSSFFEISLVLWASDDILSFQFAVYDYNTLWFFSSTEFQHQILKIWDYVRVYISAATKRTTKTVSISISYFYKS